MVKLRQAKYCNLKLLLIFLVIFGHMIEPLNLRLYHWIYAFHMPVFVMLSGMFSSQKPMILARKLLLWYIILQTVAVIFGKTSLLTPYWHLWYLLSDVSWLLAGHFLSRFEKMRWKILLLSLLLGCLLGYIPMIGRRLSLSRTIVFFPYYWAGHCLPKNLSLEKHKILGIICLVFVIVSIICFQIPTSFFFHATPYGEIENAMLLRLLCYAIGFAGCVFLLVFVPKRRFAFTKAGTDTLLLYLFHAPIVLWLRSFCTSALLCALISVGIIGLFYKLQQCGRNFCGITAGEEGRENGSLSKNI